MLKEAKEVLGRVANDHNSANCAEACFMLGRLLVSEGPDTDIRKGTKYLKMARKKGHSSADSVLSQLHQQTKDGKFLGPLNSVRMISDIRSCTDKEISTLAKSVGDTLLQTKALNGSSINLPGGEGAESDIGPQECSDALKCFRKAASVVDEPACKLINPDEKLRIMQQYVQQNPASVAGHALLLGLKHLSAFYTYWHQQDYHGGLMNLFQAYAFDEKAVAIPVWSDAVSGTNICMGEPFQSAHVMLRNLCRDTSHPMYFYAVCTMASMESRGNPQALDAKIEWYRKAIAIAEASDAAPAHKAMLPNLYCSKAHMLMFRKDVVEASQLFMKSAEFLRTVPTATLFPYEIPNLPLQVVKQQHLTITGCFIGRAMVEFPLKREAGVGYLQEYLDTSQVDETRYYETHFDLALALALGTRAYSSITDMNARDSAQYEAKGPKAVHGTDEVIAHMERLVARAQQFKHCRIPILALPDDEELPEALNTKSMLACLKIAKTVQAGKVKNHSKMTSAHAAYKCWGCNKEAQLVCTGCKIARFCGRDCQVKNWKQHKLDCSRFSGAATT
jgi:hypothetical protein